MCIPLFAHKTLMNYFFIFSTLASDAEKKKLLQVLQKIHKTGYQKMSFREKMTPLMICASLDRKDCCEWLIEKRVNIADEDTSRHNAIWYANNANHPVLANWLQSRLNVDGLCEGLPVTLKDILARIDEKGPHGLKFKKKQTPLMLTAQLGRRDVCEWLSPWADFS